jgi:hypothetical protein
MDELGNDWALLMEFAREHPLFFAVGFLVFINLEPARSWLKFLGNAALAVIGIPLLLLAPLPWLRGVIEEGRRRELRRKSDG